MHDVQTESQKDLALFSKAQQAYQLGLLEEAEADFLTITKRKPEYYEAWFRLGNIYVRTGQLKAAERMFERSVQLNPEEFKAWNNLALTYIKQAIAVLEESQTHLEPSSEEYSHADNMMSRLIDTLTKP